MLRVGKEAASKNDQLESGGAIESGPFDGSMDRRLLACLGFAGR